MPFYFSHGCSLIETKLLQLWWCQQNWLIQVFMKLRYFEKRLRRHNYCPWHQQYFIAWLKTSLTLIVNFSNFLENSYDNFIFIRYWSEKHFFWGVVLVWNIALEFHSSESKEVKTCCLLKKNKNNIVWLIKLRRFKTQKN